MIFPNKDESSHLLSEINVRVINNSWGSLSYPLINKQIRNFLITDYSKDSFVGYNNIIKDANPMSRELAKLAKEKKVISVFASGNGGVIAPARDRTLPSYDESIRAWLNVGNQNAFNTIKEKDGSITLKGEHDIVFKTDDFEFKTKDTSLSSSNSFKGATNYSLLLLDIKFYLQMPIIKKNMNMVTKLIKMKNLFL